MTTQRNKSLIPIGESNIGDETIQTVNARDLHEFLEVTSKFADWIKRRIEEYSFIEEKDYVFFSNLRKTSQDGRPTKEYHVSLDMAKELSMVEKTEKGKQARRYFIDCEKKLKENSTKRRIKKEGRITSLMLARELKGWIYVGDVFGLDDNQKKFSANQRVKEEFGVDCLNLLGITHLKNEKQEIHFTPTELGKPLGLSGRSINKLLESLGFQAKVNGHWQVTEKGKPYAVILDTGKSHSNGTPVQQIKWYQSVMDVIDAEVEEELKADIENDAVEAFESSNNGNGGAH